MPRDGTPVAMTEARIVSAGQVILIDPDQDIDSPQTLFDPARWDAQATPRGRGSAYFVTDGKRQWVWRQFRRGGLYGRLVKRHYLYLGERRVRSFREFRLLRRLLALGLPVPVPVAARYRRSGAWYQADLMTERIGGTQTLSQCLPDGLSEEDWRAIGRCLRRFHAHGACHADLNAHNILIGQPGRDASRVHLVDFDRGSLRPPGRWAAENLRRLQRSLHKLAAGQPVVSEGWRALLAAYGEAEARPG